MMLMVYAPLAYLGLTLMMMIWLPSSFVGICAELAEREAAEQWPMQRCKAAEYDLQTALDRVATLEGELAEARQLLAAESRATAPVYRHVGLHEECPDFLITAARRAYRIALHPDQHPENRKASAQARFVAAEAAFEQIARRRGL
jgi:hypothetical protein